MDEKLETNAPETEAKQKNSRRDFMTVSGTLLAGAALSGCTAMGGRTASLKVKPMEAHSYNRIVGANERIRVGHIGVGGMGTGQLKMITSNSGGIMDKSNVLSTAVCDVYDRNRDRARDMCKGQAFHHYQELLSSGLVDCVIIATPEHWHAQISLDAEACGLDVYCQKPMTHDFADCQKMYDRLKDSKCVFQLGTQYMQTPVYWRAREVYQKLVEEKKLQRRVLVTTGYSRNSTDGEWNYYKIDPDAAPGVNLDWKMWLGPLPYMEYKPEYFFRWRKYKEFSAGPISDLLPHKMHAICYVMGAAELPRSVSCFGGIYYPVDERTAPDTALMSIDYGTYTMLLFTSTANGTFMDTAIRCHEGDLVLDPERGTLKVTPQRGIGSTDFRQMQEECAEPDRDSTVIHMAEWFDCMRTRKKPTWHIEPSYNVMTAIAMAQESYDTGKTVHLKSGKLLA